VHGSSLDELLDGIAGTLVEVHAIPTRGLPRVEGLAILDPDDELRDHHGELVLVIGARGRVALAPLRAAADSGAVAVAVKIERSAGGSRDLAELVAASVAAGVVLLAVGAHTRWDQLGALLRERLEAAELVATPGVGSGLPGGEDLFALAESTSTLTGGIVSIEDPGNRVLAYSRSDDAVDELRRLSILGWQGPESYMRLLREWGVLDRLREGDRVVRVEARPELGVRERLAIGIRAGSRYLGTIWVQQRFEPVAVPFTERAPEALLGASRLAAAEILRRRTGASLVSARTQLVELLAGRANPDLVAGRLGLDPARRTQVVGFGGPAEPEAAIRELHHDQLRGIVSVYASAYHPAALVALDEQRVYAVLPDVRAGAATDDASVRSWVGDAVVAARERTGVHWRAGISTPVPALAELPSARAEVDRVLDAVARSELPPLVAGISELRSELLLAELADVLGARTELWHPGITALLEYDAERGGELARSVTVYLDALGDVRAAARSLHVHPNTLRHRLRRAVSLTGIDLDDPGERLSCHLQLLVARRLGRVP
jgi:DNA-binding PucR family transcriptional regulator